MKKTENGRGRRRGRRSSTNKTRKSGDILSLPSDLLTEVLARVASSSFTDLFSAKLCCRQLLDAAESDYIYEHVTMDKFQVISWFGRSGGEIEFLNRCKEKENPEALFRQGLEEYFSNRRMDIGLDHLKRAAEKRHREASYVYGIILLSKGGDESTKDGLKFLNWVSSESKNWKVVRQCRARTMAMIRNMWIRNFVFTNFSNNNCRNTKVKKGRRSWNRDDDEDKEEMCCDGCNWEEEVVSFCEMLRGV